MQDQPAAQKEMHPIKLIVIVEDDHDIALTLVEMIEKMHPYKALVISENLQRNPSEEEKRSIRSMPFSLL